MWMELVDVVKDLLNLYHELLLLAKKKKDIIVAAKMNDLTEIVKQEQKLVVAANALEKRRQQLVVRMANGNLIPSRNMELAALLEYCDPSHVKVLTKLRLALKQVTQELQMVNAENGKLVGKALSFVEFNINVLSQAQADPVYSGQPQNPGQVTNRRLFDQKV